MILKEKLVKCGGGLFTRSLNSQLKKLKGGSHAFSK